MADDGGREGAADAVRAAVCANINLFMELNEEEFAKYLGTFAQDVWTQLTRVTLAPGQARAPRLPDQAPLGRANLTPSQADLLTGATKGEASLEVNSPWCSTSSDLDDG